MTYEDEAIENIKKEIVKKRMLNVHASRADVYWQRLSGSNSLIKTLANDLLDFAMSVPSNDLRDNKCWNLCMKDLNKLMEMTE